MAVDSHTDPLIHVRLHDDLGQPILVLQCKEDCPSRGRRAMSSAVVFLKATKPCGQMNFHFLQLLHALVDLSDLVQK